MSEVKDTNSRAIGRLVYFAVGAYYENPVSCHSYPFTNTFRTLSPTTIFLQAPPPYQLLHEDRPLLRTTFISRSNCLSSTASVLYGYLFPYYLVYSLIPSIVFTAGSSTRVSTAPRRPSASPHLYFWVQLLEFDSVSIVWIFIPILFCLFTNLIVFTAGPGISVSTTPRRSSASPRSASLCPRHRDVSRRKGG